MSEEEVADANEKIAHPPVAEIAVSQRLGLFVVGRLAARLGATVGCAAAGRRAGRRVACRTASRADRRRPCRRRVRRFDADGSARAVVADDAEVAPVGESRRRRTQPVASPDADAAVAPVRGRRRTLAAEAEPAAEVASRPAPRGVGAAARLLEPRTPPGPVPSWWPPEAGPRGRLLEAALPPADRRASPSEAVADEPEADASPTRPELARCAEPAPGSALEPTCVTGPLSSPASSGPAEAVRGATEPAPGADALAEPDAAGPSSAAPEPSRPPSVRGPHRSSDVVPAEPRTIAGRARGRRARHRAGRRADVEP